MSRQNGGLIESDNLTWTLSESDNLTSPARWNLSIPVVDRNSDGNYD
jgi:hypothetical protein